MTTNRTLDATMRAHQFATTHNLPAYRIDVLGGVAGGSKEYNPATEEWDLPGLPQVSICLHDGPEFAAWFKAVGVTSVLLGRRENDTTVNAHARHHGIRWSFWGSLSRPASWARVPAKPGWGRDGMPRNEASVTLPEFEALLPSLGRDALT